MRTQRILGLNKTSIILEGYHSCDLSHSRRKYGNPITLTHYSGDLTGSYFPLGAMTKEVEDDLQNCGFLFQKPTPNNVLANCGAARGLRMIAESLLI